MTATLRQALADYLALRRALGFHLVSVGRLLEQFLDYLDNAGAATVTTEHALTVQDGVIKAVGISGIDDVGDRGRWRGYCQDVAAETSVRSVMTIPLIVSRHSMGALNLYGERPHASMPNRRNRR